MTRGLRRRIFYGLIALFVVGGTAVVLYAQGWRLSLAPFKAQKVGAIYVRSFPTDAAVKLNGKDMDRNLGLFDRGTLLSDLLPGTYTLEVNAPGFQPWKANLAVQSSLVTRREYLVLLPVEATAVTTTPVRNIAAAGANGLILQTSEGGLQTLAGMPLAGDRLLAVSSDGTAAITYSSLTAVYLALNLPQATSTPLQGLRSASRSGLSVLPVPNDSADFLVQDGSALELLRAQTGEIVKLATSSSVVALAPGRAVWTDYDRATRTTLFSYYDIGARALSRDSDSLPGRVTAMTLRSSDELFALTDDGSLYLLNLGQTNRTRLAQNIRSLSLAPDGSALAALDTQGVRIFFLRSDEPQIAIALPNVLKVRQLIWYRDYAHLLIDYGNELKFLDLTDQGLEHFATAATTDRAAYLPDANALYFIQNDRLFQLTFPNG